MRARACAYACVYVCVCACVLYIRVFVNLANLSLFVRLEFISRITVTQLSHFLSKFAIQIA